MFNTKVKPVDQPFPEKLRGYIAHPPSGSIKMLITPEMALEMLTFNTRNRPVSKGLVALYARQMADGQWRYTGEPIIFSDEGRLIEGQHRLLACMESGASFCTDVTFGRPDDAFAYINTGKVRGGGDVFAINGVQSAKAAAAITRVIVNLRNTKHLTGSYTMTPAELYEEYEKLQGFDGCTSIYFRFQKAGIGLPSVMGATYYLCSQKNQKDADYFFNVALEGGGRGKNTPEQELHRALIKNAVASEKMRNHAMAGLVITAWNRARAGLSGRGLKFASDGKIPAVR